MKRDKGTKWVRKKTTESEKNPTKINDKIKKREPIESMINQYNTSDSEGQVDEKL